MDAEHGARHRAALGLYQHLLLGAVDRIDDDIGRVAVGGEGDSGPGAGEEQGFRRIGILRRGFPAMARVCAQARRDFGKSSGMNSQWQIGRMPAPF